MLSRTVALIAMHQSGKLTAIFVVKATISAIATLSMTMPAPASVSATTKEKSSFLLERLSLVIFLGPYSESDSMNGIAATQIN